ncbi:hypothetical protein G6F46_000799 [Rhizopus delemar]|nr:hypothetical protein G6F54_002283 [Rhizopus delemar]KAG1517057.1 hypothetical protein G6F53_001675 [Rhizopus delemar]KAG1562103.1 hypothetical protein G6F49_001216 [Rhizopus delemar]KAG1592622.1 hypothetical protein G6F48_002531 [Rhizopus delemar]KAG1602385.1 hypothetical protein G6F47_002814 [Rhizopus delemar]
MTPETEQYNTQQWDILQEDYKEESLINPLINELTVDNEPAVLTPQYYAVEEEEEPEENKASNEVEVMGKVQVTEPRKEVEQQSTFVSYLVISKNTSVRRRFQDFVWLHNVLYTHYPACFVPPLPDKHRLEYVKGDRFSNDFIEKRRISLERFIERITRHPILRKAEFFIMFLESSEFNDASARALRESQETVMDTIGDTLLNAFAKIRKRDPRFIEMKEKSDRMEENLDLLQRTLLRSNKRTEELCEDYEELRASVRGLSEIESDEALVRFGSTLERYAEEMRRMTREESKWQIEVHDYMAYYRSIKGVLKLRDQKQLDYEELSDYYQSTLEEKEKIVRNKKDGSMANFISDKINEVRGADADKIKREKILRLDERMRELQEAIGETHKVSTAFSDQVKKEDIFFNRNKSIELFDVLKSYTDSKVTHYREVK